VFKSGWVHGFGALLVAWSFPYGETSLVTSLVPSPSPARPTAKLPGRGAGRWLGWVESGPRWATLFVGGFW